MILKYFLFTLLGKYIIAKSIKTKDTCEEGNTYFFVTDNASLKTKSFVVYENISEENCSKTCIQNKDNFQKPILCNSFTYDHINFSCTIYKEKSAPAGSAQIETAVGKRHFEKICLSNTLHFACRQPQFIRVDQSVLVGYAVNMTLTDSIESCVSQCVQESDCKSAMYFYQDGECITNKESAITKPAGFTKENEDRVIYFQNGCIAETDTTAELQSGNRSEKNDHITNFEINTDEQIKEEITPKNNIQISETTPVSSKEDNEPSETPNSEENHDDFDEEYENESTELETVTTKPTLNLITSTTTEVSSTSVTQTISKNKIKPVLQKKIVKHPKNFGSKTYEILKNQETVKQAKSVDIKSEEKSIESETIEELEETYFSSWSDWTPCTKSKERQVRRRRCLNLRKCLGALMQVQNCPEIIQTSTVKSNNSVRSVVSVDGEEYDEPISVDNIFVDLAPSKLLPSLNEQMWGSWQGSCQQFASSQPCNNGSMIGFESRECIAKDPSQCEGPFFRYCTLNC